ncbi:hypothetical protein [Helicobacter bilis]|uniref:hypothetical protein n=1 Tax=Helicobacter bilis TaxID=37372 RepID=UPI0010FD571E|nr:hypothetical protein [Helicobacter bilis]MDY4399541.1 hypothetical protein [Helicobacter bilis]TLE07850.1 hypothetical protein LS78_007500 [Helicobacter bilis]
MQLSQYIKSLFKKSPAQRMSQGIHLQTLDSLTPTNVLTQINNVWTYKATMGGGGGFHPYISLMTMQRMQNHRLIHGLSFE